MSYEIERKFLLAGNGWRETAEPGDAIRQGYLSGGEQGSVRVRTSGDRAWLNIKGATVGAMRREFEYPIPVADAEILLTELCRRPLIEKTRYRVAHGRHLWEVDIFAGDNDGLEVAEIELAAVDEPFERPPWVGDEVTDDPRYYNASLVKYPYRAWRSGT